MKKIEIIAYKLADGSFVNADDVTAGDLVRGAASLYTREALEAVAEAVKAQCLEDAAAWSMSFVQVDNAPHGIDDELGKYVDTAAIINQLTGE